MGGSSPLSLPPSTSQAPSLDEHIAKGQEKGGRQEKKNLLIYTDYSEQEENDGLHHTSPTHNKRSTIQQAVRK
jgi:hypothetical protein